jgi:hypothetical protein
LIKYDWLPQSEIIQAVKWILHIVRRSHRRSSVSVHKSSSKLSRIGPSSNSSDFIEIPLQDLCDIAIFEIEHGYSTLGDLVFLQLLGIPIGGPGSPGYSMAVCILFETKFRNSLQDHMNIIFLFRYFDDLRSLGVFHQSDQSSKQLVMDQLSTLQKYTYHPSMQLVIEECSNENIQFLEGSASVNRNALSLSWVSKNFASILTSGKLKYFTSQDFFSFAGRSKQTIRLATVIGKMSTVMHYSLTYRDLVKGFSHLLLELIAKKYPRKCIQRACEKMF